MKSYTYHTSHSYIDVKTGDKISLLTDWYPTVGSIYCIINNDPGAQFTMHPKDLVKAEKALKKLEEKNEIKDLVFGTPKTVEI